MSALPKPQDPGIHSDPALAIIDLLRRLNARPEQAVSLYDIGVPLVGDGFTEPAIVNGLFYLQSDGMISLMDGNRLVVTEKFIKG